MHFLPQNIDDYAVAHTMAEPELLQKLNRETNQKVLQPRMLSGHFQGRVLSMISKLISPKRILEIGTYTGYSALCLAEGLVDNGEIHTIDINEELYDFQRRYFDASGYGHQIHQYLGDALEIIKNMDMTFDLIFIDADKENYPAYFHACIDKLPSGGVLLSDNVLWSGKVLEDIDEEDQATKSLVAYNELLINDSRVETVLLPIRDGLSLTRKK